MILQSLAGLPAFLVYFCTAVVAVVGYLFVYTRVTPHDEFQLIRDNDPAAAIALGLSLLGFVLPVVSAGTSPDSGSGGVTRGGFGSFAHAFTSHFSGGG
jgi:uncharacterized membrane protein YjfL (UPF0719 family)